MNRKKIGTLKDLNKSNQFSRWIDGHDVLIFKFNNLIQGISNICTHFGGPIGYHEIEKLAKIKKKNNKNIIDGISFILIVKSYNFYQ